MEFYKGLLGFGNKMKTWDTALWAYSQARLMSADSNDDAELALSNSIVPGKRNLSLTFLKRCQLSRCVLLHGGEPSWCLDDGHRFIS